MWAFPLIFQIPKTSKALDECHSYIHPCMKFFSHSEFLECIVFLLTLYRFPNSRSTFPHLLYGTNYSSLKNYIKCQLFHDTFPVVPRQGLFLSIPELCEYCYYYSIQHGVSQLCSARSVLHLAHLLIDSTNIY